MSESQNPYMNVQKGLDNLLTKPIEEMQRWRKFSLALLGIITLLVLGLISLSLKSKVTTWVVEVDRTGRAVVAGKAQNIDLKDQRIVRAYLYRYIEMARSIITDSEAMRKNLDEVYQMSSSPMQNFLNEYYQHNNPFEKARNSSVQVEPASFLRESERSFIVEWKETERDASSKIVNESRFKALLTIDQQKIKSEKDLIDNSTNPFGIVVQNISWSQTL